MMHVPQRFVSDFPIESLSEHPDNPRKGDDDAVAESVEANGFYGAVIVQESTGYVLAGNTRLRVSRAGGATTIPACLLDCDDSTATRILLADNRTSDLATYDDVELRDMLLWIDDQVGSLIGTGYDDAALALLVEMLDEPTSLDVDPDEVPEHAPPISVLGDVWTLGSHRLVCGDSTLPETYEALLDGEVADMVWTDPPYGVSYVGGSGLTIQNDDLGADELAVFLDAAFRATFDCTREAAVWFVAAPHGPQFLQFAIPLTELGVWQQTIAWVKNSLVLGRADYHGRHEAIYFGWTPGGGHHRPGDHLGSTVWEIDRPKASKEHPTMKPVELITRAIRNHSNQGDVVLDPFGGSGSTLIAAHMMNRSARLVELDPKYCDVICKRYQLATGDVPVVNGVARSFLE